MRSQDETWISIYRASYACSGFFYVHRHILFYLDIWNLQCGKQRILLIFPVFSNRKQKWFLVWSLYSSSLEEYTAMPTSDLYSVMLLEYTHEPLIMSIIFIIETQLHLARIVQVSIMWPLGMKRQHGFRDEKKKDKNVCISTKNGLILRWHLYDFGVLLF